MIRTTLSWRWRCRKNGCISAPSSQFQKQRILPRSKRGKCLEEVVSDLEGKLDVRRLAKWHEDMIGNEKAALRWIKKSVSEESVEHVRDTMDPQTSVEEEAS